MLDVFSPNMRGLLVQVVFFFSLSFVEVFLDFVGLSSRTGAGKKERNNHKIKIHTALHQLRTAYTIKIAALF